MPLADILLSIAAGSLTTLSPCVFPVLPLVLGGALQRHRFAPVAMGAGMVATFTLVGVLIGGLGEKLGLTSNDTRYLGAALLLAFGLMMLFSRLDNLLKGALAPLADFANSAADRIEGEGLWRPAILGGLLGIIWSPCSGPLLGAALTLVATEGKATEGALRLGLFGLGAATPLIVVAYSSRSSLANTRNAISRHGDKARRITACLLIGLGLAILSGADKAMEARLTSMLPDAWLGLVTRF